MIIISNKYFDMEEIWKEYKTQRTDVKVSNMGNIIGTKWNAKPVKISIKNGRRAIYGTYIYRLVDYLFRGELPDGYHIHHKNLNKLDDRLDNLVRLTINEHGQIHSFKENNPMYHKEFTNEHKQHLSQAAKGNHKSKEHKEKIRISNIGKNKGKHPTEYARLKMSLSRRGNKNALGYKHTKESKLKISEGQIGKHWYNNGTVNKFAYECPEGFVPGKLSKINKK